MSPHSSPPQKRSSARADAASCMRECKLLLEWRRLGSWRVAVLSAVLRTTGRLTTRRLSAGATLSRAGAALTLSCGPTLTILARRTDFILAEFAVAVLVEFLERLAGLENFVSLDDAIVIQIQRFNDRALRTLPAAILTTALLNARPSALLSARTFALPSAQTARTAVWRRATGTASSARPSAAGAASLREEA